MNRLGPRLFPPFAQAEQETDDELSRDETTHEDVEMTAFHIRSRRFGRRRFGGLDAEEVTAFLDDVAEALHMAQMRYIETATQLKLAEKELKALTIKEASVPPLDAFSREGQQSTSIGRHVAHQDDALAETRLEVLRSTALQEVEALLHDAQKKADQLVAEATATAASILMTARDQETSLRGELSRLAESRLRMLDDVWATLNGCQEWLSMVDPRRQHPDAQHEGLGRVA
jgi:DivIVA domain-containing protein